jgi:hypothetical protein
MEYIRVRWLHDNLKEPIWLISELDDERREIRKVEVFSDGSKGYATSEIEHGGTRLGSVPVPPIDQIAAEAQFVPEQITRDEFEAIWNSRTSTLDEGLIRQT